MKTLQEIIERLAAIQTEIETRGESMTADELTALENEVADLKQQREAIETAANKRAALLDDIAKGRQGVTLPNKQRKAETTEDPLGTLEYRSAFMEYVRTGTMAPILRENAVTTTEDISAAVPTTILNELIQKLGAYGQLFSRVRKLNVKGGVQVPILSLKPEAAWITESATSDRQKVQVNTYISFSYYGLECKIAQSIIASIVGINAFESALTDMLYEAMIVKLEAGIVAGTGSGQMLGITVDTRVANGQKISMSADDISDWEQWKKKIFAKMPLKYKAGAVFVLNSATWEGYIDGMVDANGQPVGRINYGIANGIQERFGGKEVIQVEDDIIKSFDDASSGEVVGLFLNLNNYCINSNMQLSMYRYKDEDTNQYVDKALLVCDGKLLDTNGVIIIKKA